ncbi:serine/threonine protein kinase [Nannocystis sp.]|uniref:serine/threonine-protein kinase n=1 Tax=Nannocystis sp. TaxID=1962667 RepID=UPI0025CE4356|nr:serine/threonine protein kinase [Nannocystis sp.]MBK7823928.1 protein kinase [Nannocystis sp.]
MDPATSSLSPEEPAALIANRYRLLARIHAGTAGTLHRAEDLAFSRTVALRILTPALSRDEAVLGRMQARLQAGAVMAREDLGADIIELTDLGRTDAGLVFVVTEFLAGDSLATQLAREGPMAWRTLRPLMVRACQIIHLSHQHGRLRLDLQTRHFFPIRDKSRTSTLKILSTGIGDVFGDNLWASLSPAAAAAHLRYAAPEQVTGGNVDARTDVYALGVIMYELLTGRVPFPDPRPAYVCARHLLEPAPLLTTGPGGPIPEAVAAIVARALAKAPEDRWPTMRALANAMAAIEFGPCDASGVLEVEDVSPPTPAASSASMRIDPSARHAPSPAVRPKTLPPLRDAFMADAQPSEARAERPTAAPRPPVPEDRSSRTPADPLPPGSPVLSASPDPRDPGSSSTMAWEEILAAADEAVAAVASVATSGTAGDSGVFIPERLLHSGEAATASMTRGRRNAASSQSATVILPRTLVLRADAEVAAASTTLQLDDADLRDIDDPAGDSAADLPTLTSRRARTVRNTAATTMAPTTGTPGPAAPPSSVPASAPATGVGLAAAGSTLDQPAPFGHASVTEVAASSHGSTDSAGSLRAAIDRSATVWPLASRSLVVRSPARPIAWAAALLVTLAGVAGGVRLLRPREPATPPIVALTPTPVHAPLAGSRDRSRATAPSATAAPVTDLSPGTGPSASAAPVTDLSQETSSRRARDPEPTQWPGRVSQRPPEPTVAVAAPSPEPAVAVAPAAVASSVTPPADTTPEPRVVAPVLPASDASQPAITPPRPGARTVRIPPTSSAETSADPPPGPRKSSPGARLPDAGHELAAPLDHDPMRAASLLTRAEQAAARGEQGLALSLAIQSYHAGPSTSALHLAGKLACKLGDADKARWARTHLAAADRGPVQLACEAAGVALE